MPKRTSPQPRPAVSIQGVQTRTLAHRAANQYLAAGWPVIPFRPGSKVLSLKGVTGADGVDLEPDQIHDLIGQGYTNLAVRVPPNHVGIDVDAYEDKHGDVSIKALQEATEPLPPTFSSGNRGFGPSQISYYKVAPGTRLVGGLKDVEMCQWWHRYCMVWPSIHPSGRQYEWFGPNGQLLDRIPEVSGLATLPTAIQQYLHNPRPLATKTAPVGTDQVSQWLEGLPNGRVDRPVQRCLEDALRDLDEGVLAHYDIMTKAQWHLVCMGHEGKRGVAASLKHLRDGYLAYTTTKTDRDGAGDWSRALEGAVSGALSRPETVQSAGSWEPIDLSAVLSGNYVTPEPVLMRRDDGRCMFYAGKVHWLMAEPESGKSWLAIQAVAQALAADLKVGYIDYEDDRAGMVSRLRLLDPTLTDQQILSGLVYVEAPPSPEDDGQHWAAFLRHQFSLVVIDAMVESAASIGADDDKRGDVQRWVSTVTAPIVSRTGAAVVVVDHVVKNRESRGRWAVGSGHKLATLTGSAFMIEMKQPFVSGQTGSAWVLVAKDRLSQVRKYSYGYEPTTRMQLFAVMVLDSETVPGRAAMTLRVPTAEEVEAFSKTTERAGTGAARKAERDEKYQRGSRFIEQMLRTSPDSSDNAVWTAFKRSPEWPTAPGKTVVTDWLEEMASSDPARVIRRRKGVPWVNRLPDQIG